MEQAREHGIIRQVLAGDREAFALLVEAYQAQLFHMAYVLTGNRAQAEDAVQETFVAAYDKLASFKLRPEFRLLPWLFAICRHAVFRQQKKAGRLVTGMTSIMEGGVQEGMQTQRSGGAGSSQSHEATHAAAVYTGEEFSPEDATFRSEQGRLLAKHLMALPLELREAVVFRFTEDLTFAELAEVLGISVQAAKMRVYRGLTKLRERMPEK